MTLSQKKEIEKKFDEKFWLEITSEGIRGVTPKQYEEIKSFLFSTLDQALAEQRKELNDCSCKEKWTFEVVHRKDEPCYWPEAHETVEEHKDSKD